jgi:hypothetical protein
MPEPYNLMYDCPSVKQGDIIGLKLDLGEGTISFVLNGKDKGVALQSEELKTGEYYPAVYMGQSQDIISISKPALFEDNIVDFNQVRKNLKAVNLIEKTNDTETVKN